MASIVRWGVLGGVAGMAAAAACAGSAKPYVAPEPADGPAYWESDIPREPAPHAPGTRYESWPLLDAGAGEGRGGTTDPFLWDEEEDASVDAAPAPDEGAEQGTGSDPQRPLRLLSAP